MLKTVMLFTGFKRSLPPDLLGLLGADEICSQGIAIIWEMFVQSATEMEKNDLGEPCHGRTALTILNRTLLKFQSSKEVIDLVKSSQCLDGIPRTPGACERGWRGEICRLCPLHS